jgi:ubiquinone/menaquinone biosynthesis C-methylase UbiE
MQPESLDENTYIFDPESPAELGRLMHQDRTLTRGMGGALSGLSATDISTFKNVLDVGCGPGGWVLDVAFEHPQIEVAGVDISRAMINYANTRASVQKLANASFEVMDITKPLNFSDGAFDMVNARFLFAVLRRDTWPAFIAECTRILRPGGILRLTEPSHLIESSSRAGERLGLLMYRALWKAGYGFSMEGNSLGVSYKLPRFLRRAGYQHIQHAGYALDMSSDSDGWADGYHNVQVGAFQSLPLFVHTQVATKEEVEALYQQSLVEMQAPDFTSLWYYFSVWGKKPE